MRGLLVAVSLAAVLIGVVPRATAARLVEQLTFEELLKQADLVVIATATGTKDNNVTTKLLQGNIDYMGVDTTFEVQTTLKGKAPGKKLVAMHFRPPDDTDVIGGPNLVSFRDAPVAFRIGSAKIGFPAPDYMLFLKSPKNPKETRYELVTGRVDPIQSARELHRPGLSNTLAEEGK